MKIERRFYWGYPKFAQNINMASSSKNKGLMWILFLLSTAAFIFACFAHWPWLTLILPFVTTFFVKAMDII